MSIFEQLDRVTYLRFPTTLNGRRHYDGFAVAVDRKTVAQGAAHASEKVAITVVLDGARYIATVPLLREPGGCRAGLCPLRAAPARG